MRSICGHQMRVYNTMISLLGCSILVLSYVSKVDSLQTGRDACLQIYSVPRQSVVCELQDEVRQELNGLHKSISDNQKVLDKLQSSVNALDPSISGLPEDILSQLNEINILKSIQENQTGTISELTMKYEGLLKHIAIMEDASRQQFTRLVQMQTELISSMIHQSNASLYGDHLDQLNETLLHFTIQMNTLELGLRDTLTLKETQLLNQMSETARLSRKEIARVQDEYMLKLLQYSRDIENQREMTLDRLNLTLDREGNLGNFNTQIENLFLKQQLIEEHHKTTRDEMYTIQTESKTAREELINMTAKMDSLQMKYDNLNIDLQECRSNIANIRADIKAATEVVQRWKHITPRVITADDCDDALRFYQPVSGVYTISPGPALQPYEVYCDMAGDIGWTVIQSRRDGTVDFFRGWQDYREGFGDATAEYWLGLQKIHILTTTKSYQLRVELQDWKGKWYFAQYDSFYVDSEEENYTLHVSGYHGNAGDSLGYHDNMPFTTMDRNNDQKDGLCASWCHGAWWYKDCFLSNLNGRFYHNGPYVPDTNWGDGINWKSTFGTYYYSFKTTAMKIRPAFKLQ